MRRQRPKRPKRPSRFARMPVEPTPRFQEGDQAGEFNVLEYLGYGATKPHEPVRLRVEHHWYRCRCSCGNEEIHTQQQLIDVRRNRCCSECSEAIQDYENARRRGDTNLETDHRG